MFPCFPQDDATDCGVGETKKSGKELRRDARGCLLSDGENLLLSKFGVRVLASGEAVGSALKITALLSRHVLAVILGGSNE